jgi:hypothetical protein
MRSLLTAAQEVQRFCQKRKWRFCIIGGLAVNRWGEPRGTKDVDLALLTGFKDEDKYVDGILAAFAPRIEDARTFALAHRVILCKASNGTPVDIALAALPFEEKAIARASPFKFAPRLALVTASAEDLIILKALADRPHDWGDIQGVVHAQGSLDWNYIETELRPLLELKEDTSAFDKLHALREERRRVAAEDDDPSD